MQNRTQESYFVSNRHTEFVTQLPFELDLAMPEPDSGRGYSNEYISDLKDKK